MTCTIEEENRLLVLVLVLILILVLLLTLLFIVAFNHALCNKNKINKILHRMLFLYPIYKSAVCEKEKRKNRFLAGAGEFVKNFKELTIVLTYPCTKKLFQLY